jgi:DNA-directed RNA polymerase specialized sigma24 family protein
LRRIEQRPVAEVAARLGLTRAQVRAYDHRLLKRLRALLEGHPERHS